MVDYDLGTLWDGVKYKYERDGRRMPWILGAAHRLLQQLLWWLSR